MKAKSTYRLKRSAEYNAQLIGLFMALLFTAAAVNSCNKAATNDVVAVVHK